MQSRSGTFDVVKSPEFCEGGFGAIVDLWGFIHFKNNPPILPEYLSKLLICTKRNSILII